MPLQAVREGQTSYREPFAAQSPEELLKRLVAYLTVDEVRTLRKHRLPEHASDVLFDTEIDGTHYYVVCHRQLPAAPAVNLSPRELAIARLIAKGLPNKSISDLLDISPYTVATHLRRIFVKLGVSSRAAMVAQLLEQNALEL